ncbi:DNA internalization-related competence protein ComEC/Rec2 [Sinimarinibacterium thermocellulolyticum]|uniref:DNA internalization-related competence protein ComEC/Rec2 n=1 Tax=Sinimarinibacterium thermocellulolyticum TaxID=3170016 RepID=A0ABV2A643_9GAMM
MRGAAPIIDLRTLALAYSAGITAVFLLPTLPSLSVCVLLALPALLPWRGRPLYAATLLGVLFACWQAQRALDQRLPAARHGENLWVEGVVASLPERQTHDDGTLTSRFAFETEQAGVPPRLRVSWYRSEAQIAAGQCWRLQLRLRAPRGSLNPGGFDYEAWLLRERIGATASVRSGERCEDARGHRILRWRRDIVAAIDDVLGERPAAALLAALSVGDTSAMREVDWQRFRVTGTTHLIAISGFNLAIVSGFAFFVLRWIWSLSPALCLRLPAQRAGLYASAAVALVYALLAGFEPPVTRALIMLLVLILAAAFDRLQQPSRALIYAFALIVTLDPFAVLSPGLWLSFAAVAAILYVSLGRARRPPAWRLAFRVQLFLSLALVPLTMGFFAGFAWLSPLANLIAVPVFGVLTPMLMCSLLLYGLWAALGEWCLRVSGWLLDGVYAALAWAADAAPLAWWPARPHAAALALGTLGAVLLFAPRGLPLRPLALIGLATLALPRAQTVDDLDVTALDVGQGTAVVIRTPRHTLLFDAGPAFDEGFDAGRSVVVPYLLSQGIRRIDALVLSHGDNDHAGGIDAVRAALPVARVIGTADGEPCMDGLSWSWEGVRFRFLHPDQGYWSPNNRSCVLHVDGAFDVLLPGDIERGAEARLLRTHRERLDADLLLSPHHGSGSSSTAGFIAAVSPAIVIHPAGWRSRYGHPRADVVARYAAARARQYVTGVEGALRVSRDAAGELRVEGWRRRAARWWNAPAQP